MSRASSPSETKTIKVGRAVQRSVVGVNQWCYKLFEQALNYYVLIFKYCPSGAKDTLHTVLRPWASVSTTISEGHGV